jgi:hypothetical protein
MMMRVNLRALSVWVLTFIAGYCLGGKIGVGIAAGIILLCQLL